MGGPGTPPDRSRRATGVLLISLPEYCIRNHPNFTQILQGGARGRLDRPSTSGHRIQLSQGDNGMKLKKAFTLISTLAVLVSLAGILPVLAAPQKASANDAAAQTYVVVYKKNAVPSDAASAIQKAGGSVVYSYKQIGVVIASSA